MTTIANKRSLEEANIDSLNPTKKRKLNEDESKATTTDNNNNTDNNDDKKNDNTAKSNDDEQNEKKEKNEKNDPNADVSNWSFKASDFTFGNDSWVKQTSNASDLFNEESTTDTTNDNDKVSSKAIIDKNTTDSFAKFEGLGFKKVLDDENSKSKPATDGKSEKDKDNTENDKDKDKDNDKDTKEKDDGGWGGAWGNSNPDGTYS